MGNKEDWEELEKWQKEHDEKLEQKGQLYAKTFDEKKIKGIKLITKLFNFMTKTVLVLFTTIFTIGVIISLIYVYTSFLKVSPKNVTKYLKDIYKEENFEILEEYSDNIGKGLYILRPESNKEIVFKAYNGGSTVRDDYSAQRLKYYIDKCSNKKLTEGFIIEEKVDKTDNGEFLQYSIKLEIKNYKEIEEKVEKAYKLAKYLNGQDEKLNEAINILNSNKHYYHLVVCNTTRTLEQEINNAKYEYIHMLKKNNDKELSEIDSKEIEEIYKPMSLLLIINGKQMKLNNNADARVFYGLEDGKYHMSGTEVILLQIEPIKVLTKGIFTGIVKEISYKEKKYKVEISSDSGNINDKIVYTTGTLEQFLQNFDSEIVYDYKNEKVYVTIK